MLSVLCGTYLASFTPFLVSFIALVSCPRLHGIECVHLTVLQQRSDFVPGRELHP